MTIDQTPHDQMPHRLDGKVAVITGAGRGIGEATAHVLAGLGSKIVVLDIDMTTAETVAASLTDNGADTMALECDVADEAAVIAAAAAVVERFGTVDILVNNAGVISWTPLEKLPSEEWDRVCNVNLRGVFLCTKYFGLPMLEQRSGSIINISSVAGTVPEPNAGAYAATKAGIICLGRQVAVEWGSRGVRCNTVSPGIIQTPMSAAFLEDPDALAQRMDMVASRRIGTPAELGQTVAFLASDTSSFVNGQNLEVDGGMMQMFIKLLPRPGIDMGD